MENEHMQEGPTQLSSSQACVVYDERDGRIVHIHEFVPAAPGDTWPLDELHAAAMDMASRLDDTDFLAIADVPEELIGEHATALRLDLSTREVKGEPVATSAAEQEYQESRKQ